MAQMPKLQEALNRFDSALQELEAALVRSRSAQVESRPVNDGEVQALREDRARLASELDDVRNNANRLMDNNHKAAEKVASAMSRIKSVLGE